MTRPTHEYITDEAGLRELCARLRDSDRFALDTEFVGEETFVPRLEIIQIAMEGYSAVIDFPAVAALDRFAEVLGDPRIEKVMHAGRQDLELFFAHSGQVTSPVFDTQVAAAMVGYGTQVAYAQLVERVLGTKLAKSHTLTNWSQRPLTPDQITYALEDVHFLLPLHEHLRGRLTSLGREEWVKEEFQQLESRLSDGSRDPRLRYQRVKGWENLRPRAAAVLRELAAWREEEAGRRNVPRGRVVRDEVLVELARRMPGTLSALKATRGLHPSEVERNGEALLAAIRRGLAVPEAEWPEVPAARKPEPEMAGLVDLLQAALKLRAHEEAIAPTLLATAGDLQTLIEARRSGQEPDLPVLRGWRRSLAGESLLQILAGRLAVSVDPRTGRARLSPKE
jgi:ribonuclease D